MATTSERLKELRTELGMNQKEFGAAIGVKISTVCRWENGSIRTLKPSHIVKISDKFNVNPVWIIGLDVSKEKRTEEERNKVVLIENIIETMDGTQLDLTLMYVQAITGKKCK